MVRGRTLKSGQCESTPDNQTVSSPQSNPNALGQRLSSDARAPLTPTHAGLSSRPVTACDGDAVGLTVSRLPDDGDWNSCFPEELFCDAPDEFLSLCTEAAVADENPVGVYLVCVFSERLGGTACQ